MKEVLIIGGGIIGLSLARELKCKGIERVSILEKHSMCGAEASSAAAGMLAPQAEANQDDEFFRFCQASRDLYPRFAQELFDESGVDIELDQTGTLYLAFTENDAEELEKRFEWQKNAGLEVEKLSAKEILEIEPNVSPNVLSGLRFPLDWQVENRKIIEAFNLQPNGAEVFKREVRSLIFENGKIIGIETDRDKFFAPIVVICSGAWTSLIEDNFNLLSSLKIKPIRGQMVSFSNLREMFRHVIYSPRGYAVPRRDGRILFGASVEDVGFDGRTTSAETALLLQNAFEISDELGKLSLKKTWSGLRPFCEDGLPILGEFPEIENLFIATAHYRNGILLAPLTAKILADKIVHGVDSDYLKAFGLRRFQKSFESRL